MKMTIEWKPLSTSRFFTAIAGLAILLILYQTDADGYLLGLDDMNLAFHEAGHLIFGILGNTMNLYGGTLGQLVFPTAVAITFLRQGDAAGVFGGVVWFCENLLNIARYAGDARTQVIPLLGGEHDWFNIFSRWGVLEHDTQIAGFIRFVGYAGMAAAAFGLFQLWNTNDETKPESGDAHTGPS